MFKAPCQKGSPSGEPVLRMTGVGKSIDGQTILSDVNLEVNRGETIAIIGPSGAGKTTLLRCINFLTSYDPGRIYINGELIGYREENGRLRPQSDAHVSRVRCKTGMVFQRFALFPHRTVVQNLIEGPVHVLGQPTQEATERALQVLTSVGMLDKAGAYPSELSGGQQQRVGIARALCMEPQLLLFDEATSALDPELVGEVLIVMKRLTEEHRTMVVVTHELHFAREAADRIVFMECGRVVADLPTLEFFENPPSDRVRSFLAASGRH